MASSNTRTIQTKAARTARTHEGAAVEPGKPLQELRRTTLACLLFEDTFYEGAQSTADRLTEAAAKCNIVDVLSLAAEARREHGLRHVPLWLVCAVLQHPQRKPEHNAMIESHIVAICDRVDQMGELIAQYRRGGKRPLAAVLRRALGTAFNNFNEYQLAKYAQKGAYRPRDVMFLVHPKPTGDKETVAAKEALWKRLANDELKQSETWEDKLSAGGSKHEVFTDLLTRHKMSGLALIRNLRNMEGAGVDKTLVFSEFTRVAPTSRLLPFQYIAAARACPKWEDQLEAPMLASVADLPKLPGRTLLLVDHSGSMNGPLGGKSTLNRMDAARALAILCREVCEELVIVAFDDSVKTIPPRRGFALADAVPNPRGGTDTGGAVNFANGMKPDRIIVITDEQSSTRVAAPHKRGYIMNVATYEHGISWGKWVSISGFSDQLVRFMHEAETGGFVEV